MLAIANGESPNSSWIHEGALWSNLSEARADFEVVRRYGQEPSTSTPGDRLGYLFEDVWRVETRIASCLVRALSERYGPEWWQEAVVPCLSEQKKIQLKSFSDVYLLDLMKLSKHFWTYVGRFLGFYATAPMKQFEKDIEALNEIRKTLFHPARSIAEGFSSFDEDDYDFARQVRKRLWDE
jgi:hypothetical protein